MEQKEAFLKFQGELKKQELGDFLVDNPKLENGGFGEFDMGSSVALSECLEHLSVYLYANLKLRPDKTEIDETFLRTGKIQVPFDIQVFYDGLYDLPESANVKFLEEGTLYAPEEWPSLPKKFVEERITLNKLDSFLSKPELDSDLWRVNPGMDKTFEEFYVELIRTKKLRWANILGEEFPYVISSSVALGNIGVSMGGLYFVAVDKADEPWKEQVVAFHERFCQEKGHEFALEKEAELIEYLGKQKEHEEWRKGVGKEVKQGKYH